MTESFKPKLAGENKIDEEVKIASKYDGLPADIVEELWIPTTYTDPEKNEIEKQRREKALGLIREREAEKELDKIKLEAIESKRQKDLKEVRNRLGIPNNPETDHDINYEELRKAEQIKNAFEAISEGFDGGVISKIEEYDERIRAAKNGTPIKKGDTVEELIDDFRLFTKQDWDENFNIEKFKKERDTNKNYNEKSYNEGPPINYIKVVIDDNYMRQNLMPDGGLRMLGGQANWNGEVDLMRYVVSDDISPIYRQIANEKIQKLNAEQEKLYRHESHHIHNRENNLTPHIAAKNLREFLAFRVLDEMSSFMAGELDQENLSINDILQYLSVAAKHIADSYYGKPFSREASWYMSQHGDEREVLSREINQDRYHQIMMQYFRINGQNILDIIKKNDMMPEFTRVTNELIMKLDSILEKNNYNNGNV